MSMISIFKLSPHRPLGPGLRLTQCAAGTKDKWILKLGYNCGSWIVRLCKHTKKISAILALRENTTVDCRKRLLHVDTPHYNM